MKTLMILNDAPYGSERTYNGLRLAGSLAKLGAELRAFLIGDAVACAKTGQMSADWSRSTRVPRPASSALTVQAQVAF